MSQYSRRTVVRGAAWSIPVVAVAANAPAFAASTDAPSVPGSAAFVVCKLPGAGQNCQSYRAILNLTVQPSDTWTIDFTALLVDNVDFFASVAPKSFTGITATSTQVEFTFCTASSPSQFDLTLRYSATNTRTGATTTNLGGTGGWAQRGWPLEG